MKIKESQLKKIIKESIEATISSRKDTSNINKQELSENSIGAYQFLSSEKSRYRIEYGSIGPCSGCGFGNILQAE